MLEITGEAPDRIVTTRVNAPARGVHLGNASESRHAFGAARGTAHEDPAHGAHVGATHEPMYSKFEEAALRTQARDALVGLGWKSGIASSAVDEARAQLGAKVTIEAWIREALRRRPRPRS